MKDEARVRISYEVRVSDVLSELADLAGALGESELVYKIQEDLSALENSLRSGKVGSALTGIKKINTTMDKVSTRIRDMSDILNGYQQLLSGEQELVENPNESSRLPQTEDSTKTE